MRSINTYYDSPEDFARFVSDNYDSIFSDDRTAVLVQIFSGCCEYEHFLQVSSEVYKLIPHASIIGATTGSGIMNGEVSELKTVISLSIFYRCRVKGALIEKGAKADFALGDLIASTICNEESKVLILFATSTSVNANEVLRGIQKVNPSLPVVGGNAGDICHMKPAILSYNGNVTSSGIVGVAIEGDITVNRYCYLGWQPIGKAMTVTKAIGQRVYTVDHNPAFEIYHKYLGLNKTEVFNNAVEYPLITKRSGIQAAAVPVRLYEDNSIEFAAELMENETVWLSFGNVDMILENIQNLCKEISDRYVDGILVYSCSCRKGFLQDSIRLETEPLQKIAPTAGFFTSGEFFHMDHENYLLNATMTVLALSENNYSSANAKPENWAKNLEAPYKDIDCVGKKDVRVLKALTHLSNNVISELEEAQAKLQYNIIGEMAAGIGHEVRNPMTTVRGYLQMFQRNEKFLEYRGQISTMIEELDRANAIITEFLSLSKHKRVEMRIGNINNIIHDLFPLLQADAFERGHQIRLETGSIPDNEFDSNEIKQLVINLVRNGLEAMKSAGVVIIKTRLSNSEILLSVQDTGSGIPSKIMNRLGTPFVTTKTEGTGLGLSVCYRIADRHGAKIDLKTGATGTIFTVKFKALAV